MIIERSFVGWFSRIGWVAALLATQNYYPGVIMLKIEYMTDKNEQPKAVVIPIDLPD